MAETQNGWVTIDSSDLDRSSVPGTNVVPLPGVKAGDVATILLHVGKLFNERVEKLYNPGCWGWAPATPIPGSSVYSNHGSGTAIDLNAPSFPWKVRKMTADQRTACRKIVAELGGVVAWGGDYTTYVDEMHFEIDGDATEQQVVDLAKRIRSGTAAGGDMALTREQIQVAYRLVTLGRSATQDHVAAWVGRNLSDYLQYLERDPSIQGLQASYKKAPVQPAASLTKESVLAFLNEKLK